MVLPYTFLFLAIILEVVGTLFLRDTEGFTKMMPNLIVVVSYAASFYFLSLTFQHISVSVAYAIWSGVGIVLIAILGAIKYQQFPSLLVSFGILLIVTGVILVLANTVN
tara:strand:+ start:88 stop:414 length:327 start_codon:yes stop_codon:yes gene_type:complete